MIKINSLRNMAMIAAFTISASVTANNNTQNLHNSFLSEQFSPSKDEFIQKTKSLDTTFVKNLTRTDKSANQALDSAVTFYNEKMSSAERYAVTRKTYDNLEIGLYNMEKEINEAFENCEAYHDIAIVPGWHYRFYPGFDNQLINFDLDDMRNRTTKDMQSLHKLKDNAAYIFEKANGIEKHTEPKKTKYDVDEIAQKYFDMDYDVFREKFKDEIEYCKYVTIADIHIMNENQAYVYSRAKAYATDMLNQTITEAHNVNWDIGEQKINEIFKATSDINIVNDFEYDGISQEKLTEFKSGISLLAFKDALIEIYNNLKINEENKNDDNKTAIETATDSKTIQKPIKHIVDGVIKIFKPDGSVYDLNGNRVK